MPRIRARSIDRPRLLEIMQPDGIRPALVLLYGHAGIGKSTLLSQWADAVALERGEALQWLTLREDDAGAGPFWKRVADDLDRNALLGHGLSRESLATLGAGGTPSVSSPTGTGMLTLVLDDYHLVAGPHIDAQLAHLLKETPTLRVVVGTRTMGGLFSIELAARVSTVLVDATELAFTAAESAELAGAVGLQPHSVVSDSVHSASLGWPLATHALLIEASRSSDRALHAVQSGSKSRFAREFVVATLARRTSRGAEFLLRTSLADECTVELAAALSGVDPADALPELAELEVEGTGTWQTRSGVRWFRIHPFLRQGFEAEAITTLTPDDLRASRTILSDHLRNDRPLRAMELAAELGDWTRFEEIYLLSYVQVYFYHRHAIGAMLSAIPRAAMRTHPALIAVHLAFLYGSETTTLDAMQQTLSAMRSALAVAPLLRGGAVGALQRTAVMGAFRIMGEQDAALEVASSVLSALNDTAPDELDRHRRALPILFIELANTAMLAGRYVDALDILARGRELANGIPVRETLQLKSLTALVCAASGDLVQAQQWITTCEREHEYDGWVVGYYDAGYNIAKSMCAVNQWQGAAATAALVAPRTREHVMEYWPFIAIVDAQVRLMSTGALDASAELSATLERKKKRPAVTPAAHEALLALSVDLLLQAGHDARAEATIDGIDEATLGPIGVARASLAIHRGDHVRALSIADATLRAATDSPSSRAGALVLIAQASLLAGDPDRASESFLSVTAMVERYGIRWPLVLLDPDVLAKLVALTIERGAALDPAMASGVPSSGARLRVIEPLTQSERRVIRAMVETGDVAAAAAALHLSAHTVRYHLKRTYRKLGADNRADALRIAQEVGLID